MKRPSPLGGGLFAYIGTQQANFRKFVRTCKSGLGIGDRSGRFANRRGCHSMNYQLTRHEPTYTGCRKVARSGILRVRRFFF